eukprot:symbB.v1.2.015143.t1/scaffold1124.1/size136573/9
MSRRSILGGTALAVGGLFCFKGGPDFLAPSALPRVAEPQVNRLDAPSRSTGSVGCVGLAEGAPRRTNDECTTQNDAQELCKLGRCTWAQMQE